MPLCQKFDSLSVGQLAVATNLNYHRGGRFPCECVRTNHCRDGLSHEHSASTLRGDRERWSLVDCMGPCPPTAQRHYQSAMWACWRRMSARWPHPLAWLECSPTPSRECHRDDRRVISGLKRHMHTHVEQNFWHATSAGGQRIASVSNWCGPQCEL